MNSDIEQIEIDNKKQVVTCIIEARGRRTVKICGLHSKIKSLRRKSIKKYLRSTK